MFFPYLCSKKRTMKIILIIIAIALLTAFIIGVIKKMPEVEKEIQEQLAKQEAAKNNKTNIRNQYSSIITKNEVINGTEYEIANFAVKGLLYRTIEDQESARLLKVNDKLFMEPEPENPKDPNAIRVRTRDGHHIGYIDAKWTSTIKNKMPRLKDFVVSKIDDYYDPPYIYAEAFFEKE